MEQYKFSVGTGETGGFTLHVTLEEAQAEAKGWANNMPGTEVNVYAIDERNQVVDTVCTYVIDVETPIPTSICKTHGLAILVTHVNNGEPCTDFLMANKLGCASHGFKFRNGCNSCAT